MSHVLFRAFVVGLAYYAGAWLGVHGTITQEGIAVLWPPNAVLLSAFLLFPTRQWPVIALAAIAAEIAADVPSFPVWAAVAFGLVNLAEAALAAWLIRRAVADHFDFSRLRSGAFFLLFGPFVASALAAFLGARVYVLLGNTDSSYLALWRLWWFGDALGLLLLTPPIITVWRHLENAARPSLSWLGGGELLAIWLIVIILGMMAFRGDTSPTLTFHFTPIALLPLSIWAAIRFGVLGGALTVDLIAMLAVARLVRGISPYPHVTPQEAVWLTQEYLTIVAVVSVGLAILLHEIAQQRQTVERKDLELQAQNVVLEQHIVERTTALVQANLALAEANARLQELATTDFLTGLANRGHFEELCQRELRRLAADQQIASMIVFDLDHFKSINDEHGHKAGDEILRRIQEPVRHSIRSRDLCGRVGGEEFAIFLSAANLEHAQNMAERIRIGIAALEIVHGGQVIRPTASFGVAQWNGVGDLHELMAQSDSALYRAKRSGRNRVMR